MQRSIDVPHALQARVRRAPDQEPAALVLVQVEQLDGHGFGPLAIGRFHRAEIFALAADENEISL